MEGFNAEKARKMSNQANGEELKGILGAIELKAEMGKLKMHVYHTLEPETLSGLRQRGFKIDVHPSLAIQKDNLYFTINW